eukprot:Opistho-2@54430
MAMPRRMCRRLLSRFIIVVGLFAFGTSVWLSFGLRFGAHTGNPSGAEDGKALDAQSAILRRQATLQKALREKLWLLASKEREEEALRARLAAMNNDDPTEEGADSGDHKDHIDERADADLADLLARPGERLGVDAMPKRRDSPNMNEGGEDLDEYMKAMLNGGNEAVRVADKSEDVVMRQKEMDADAEVREIARANAGSGNAGAPEGELRIEQFYDGTVHIPMEVGVDRSAVHVQPGIPIAVTPTVSGAYLFPILTYGANNQLRGLFESIVMARRLNRTLVVPDLFNTYGEDVVDGKVVKNVVQHAEEAGKDSYAVYSLSDLYDTDSIRRIIPTATIGEYIANCSGTIDSVVMMRSLQSTYNHKNLRWRFNHYAMRVRRIVGASRAKLPYADVNVFDFSRYRGERCLALGLPYHSFAIEQMPEYQDTECIMQPSPRIIALADAFIERHRAKTRARFRMPYRKDGSILSVHLRRGARWTSTYCREFYSANHTACYPPIDDVVEQIRAALDGPGDHEFVYLSTASRNKTEMAKIASAFGNRVVRIHQNTESDPLIRDLTTAELSVLEQTICMRANAFIGTAFSTWSATVDRWRRCNAMAPASLFNVLPSALTSPPPALVNRTNGTLA